MFIQTEQTPDAATMKFFPGRTVLASGEMVFSSLEDAAKSPLAEQLFQIDEVAAIALGSDFIAVTKSESANWQLIKPMILGAIMEHLMAGQPVVIGEDSNPTAEDESDEAGDTDEIVAQITELIETRVRPAVTQDGGDVIFQEFKNGKVVLEFQGSAFRFKDGITNILRHYVPEVVTVVDHRDAKPKPGLETPNGKAIAEVLETQINPAVAAHGGHIALIDVEGDTVYIRLEGGCQGCGMADVTLKQGVEVEIKRAVPSIAHVLDVTEHQDGENPYYQPSK
jgi:Fe-S cluster biogenesis protein NfuA